MRFLSLAVAAICGAIGAACLMGSGIGPMSLGTSAPAAFLADFPDADIGWGPLEESPFAIVDGPAPLHEPEPGEAIPVESYPDDDHLHVAREHGIPARLISSGAPKTTVGSRTNSGWVVIGHSAENRPLHIKTIGTGPQKTLIVAGIDGEDRIAVNWIDQWVQQLSQSPDTLRDYQLVFLRAANPDGLTSRHLENARGIDLNRNFPTGTFRPGGNPSAGTAPASEPETRLMLQLLYDLKPQRVVHLVSHAGASEAVCNGVAEEASRSLEDTAGVPVESFDPRRQAGSLEDFAATVLGIEVVTLRLRIGEDWRSAAVANYALCITAAVPQMHRGALASSGRSSATIRKPVASSNDPVSAAPTTRTRRMGYEELPPPPDKR